MRLDLLLVQKKMASSRSHAQQLIEAGQVSLLIRGEKKILKKASLDLDPSAELHVEAGPANRFVSRGGLKLEGALGQVGLSVQGLQILDIGTSTGGFADCALQKGAQQVTGVDVGHGQLSAELQGHPRLQLLEGVNARYLSQTPDLPRAHYDLVVMDVSFISISLIVPELKTFLKKNGLVLSLVKPQFEVGAEGLGKGGIVKDTSLYADVERKITALFLQEGYVVKNYFASSIEGKDGNHEFFIFAQKCT